MINEEITNRYEAAIAIESPEEKIDALNLIAWQLKILSHYDEAIAICDEALEIAYKNTSELYVGRVLNTLGNVAADRGDFPAALSYFQQAISILTASNDRYWLGAALGNCGNVYKNLADTTIALDYYHKALSIFEELDSYHQIPVWLSNIGNVFHNIGEYATALEYHHKALLMREERGLKPETGIILTNLGNAYYELKEYEKAIEYFNKSLEIDIENDQSMNIAMDYGNIGRVYALQNFHGYDPVKAEEYLVQAGDIFKKLGNKPYLYVFHKLLSDLYRNQKRWEESDTEFRKFYAVEKEVLSEAAKKQAEQLEHRRKVEESERDRQVKLARFQEQEKILHNILPAQIADRMIEGEKTIADSHEHVSVFFSDIVGFTKLSQRVSAEELVGMLNGIFTQFDQLARKHGLEKIKTIGDAYMAVCGAPIQVDNHAERTALFALEVVELMNNYTTDSGDKVMIRIGLHTGSVVAGIIGENKFAYDMWGDAVNTASRMESHGEAGKIHVSEEFLKKLLMVNGEWLMEEENDFSSLTTNNLPLTTNNHSSLIINNLPLTIIPRGEMEIKGKGKMKTYFLEPI